MKKPIQNSRLFKQPFAARLQEIPGFPGYYFDPETNKVYSAGTYEGRELKPFAQTSGQLRVTLTDPNGKKRNTPIDRIPQMVNLDDLF